MNPEPKSATGQRRKSSQPQATGWQDQDPLGQAQVLLSEDEAQAAALLAVDPTGLGGACLRSGPHPWREAWMDRLKSLLTPGTPLRRMPAGIGDSELLGGLDLPATLSSGQPVLRSGLLSQSNGGLLLLSMAERLPSETAARLTAVLDTRQLDLQREGLAQQLDLSIGLIALDEGQDEDEGLHPALQDRLAFWLQAPQAHDEPQALARAAALELGAAPDAGQVQAARLRLQQIELPQAQLQALCATAMALGIDSLRPPLLAARAARAAAALEGAATVSAAHATLAARLVLAPRALRLPPTEPAQADAQESAPPDQPPPDPQDRPDADSSQDTAQEEQPLQLPSAEELQELMVAAVQACLSPGLLAMLRAQQSIRAQQSGGGKAGAALKNRRRGRPLGAMRGQLRDGARLHVLATLRAAAPWQALRQGQRQSSKTTQVSRRIEVRREDFHIKRFRQHSSTTTVFVVDASGSSALHRLAEAKGAVELLLADCYVRRDRVAVLAFRGTQAQLLLPPTRSLTRAKRALAALPGGGGTPLAAALEATQALTHQISRSGDTPLVVLLTDGRANVARDGSPGRSQASEDALAAARTLATQALTCLLIDTSPQAQDAARNLAQAMRAHYLPLPHADAQKLSNAVRLARPQPS
jgi:magnesium chelatase subunit D